MKKLEDCLRQNAMLYPGKIAIKKGKEQITYERLYERVLSQASQITSQGKLVPFRAACSIDTLVLYFAIHLAGGVAVPLAKDLSDTQMKMYEDMGNRRLDNAIADVLFTTGTTGKSKGVMISHEVIVANAENLIASQGYHHDLTFLVNGPLNHIGSLSKIYPMVLVGGTVHLLDGMKNLNAFFDSIDEASGNVATFLVPASIRMLLAFASDRLQKCQDKIEFIETGAAPISQSDMERLCRALPHSRLYNTYASTETGIIATYDYNHDDCLAGCLGKAMRHSGFHITEDGHVACEGKTLMAGYFNEPLLTETILKDHVLYTSDLGRIDEQGRLRLEGRSGDTINVGGYKIEPTEVENVAMSIDGVEDCVCIPFQHRVLGTQLKLLVVMPDPTCFDKRIIAKALQQKLENYKVPMQYELVDGIKRTFNGKIDRKAYLF